MKWHLTFSFRNGDTLEFDVAEEVCEYMDQPTGWFMFPLSPGGLATVNCDGLFYLRLDKVST